MERDFGKELDELKNEVKRLGELLDGKAAAGKPQDGVERVGHIQRIPDMHPRPEAFVADGRFGKQERRPRHRRRDHLFGRIRLGRTAVLVDTERRRNRRAAGADENRHGRAGPGLHRQRRAAEAPAGNPAKAADGRPSWSRRAASAPPGRSTII